VKKIVSFTLIASLISIASGCTTTQKGAGIGGMLGAGTGAIIGHQTGKAAEGALIGGAVGATAGALIGEAAATKFCPTGGETYPADVQYCPKHGTKLQFKE
jgi:uncharacterized membrane protein